MDEGLQQDSVGVGHAVGYTDNWTTAWGGRVTKFGKQPVNLFGQAYYNSEDKDDEVSPEWSYKVNITFLFPA